MLLVAVIALIQLAVLVMILAVVTSPSGSSQIDPVQQSREEIGQLKQLTIKAMVAEVGRSQSETDDEHPWDS